MTLEIRLARAEDAPAVRAIYAPHVEASHTSFEEEVPSEEAFKERIVSGEGAHPWVVAVVDSIIAGYAYASPQRTRAAYRWNVEVSVYVGEAWRRRGLGAALYGWLFDLLRRQGYCNAYAGIALPNDASVKLHESLGFKRIGIYERVGFKSGSWWDVGWFCLVLRVPDQDPGEIRSAKDVLAD